MNRNIVRVTGIVSVTVVVETIYLRTGDDTAIVLPFYALLIVIALSLFI